MTRAQSRRSSARRVLLLALGFSGVLGCAGPISNIAPLTLEARENEVAAYANYRNKILRVRGVVLRTGIDHFTSIVARGHPAWGMTAREQLESYPFVLLQDAQAPSPDLLKCSFHDSHATEVGNLRPGMTVVLTGQLLQYIHDSEGLILALGGCELD
jgi:hypothetical protein